MIYTIMCKYIRCIHTYIDKDIDIDIYICVCVCVCVLNCALEIENKLRSWSCYLLLDEYTVSD